jgi:anti-sigma factor RsiW
MQQVMMPCPDFEDRLLDYAELSPPARAAVDHHIAACQGCHEYLATLEHVDRSLTSLLSSVSPSPDFAARVQARVPRLDRPRMLPELLDFVGWAAIVSILALVALFWAMPSLPVLEVAATVSVAAAVAVSLRSFADLKE